MFFSFSSRSSLRPKERGSGSGARVQVPTFSFFLNSPIPTKNAEKKKQLTCRTEFGFEATTVICFDEAGARQANLFFFVKTLISNSFECS